MVVTAKDNILVDDSLNNLNDWKDNQGISVYYGTSNNEYQAIYSLDDVLNSDKLIKLLKK